MSLSNLANKVNTLCGKIQILNSRLQNGGGENLNETLQIGNDAAGLSIEDITGNLQIQTTSTNATEFGGQLLAPNVQFGPQPIIPYSFTNSLSEGFGVSGNTLFMTSSLVNNDQAIQIESRNGGITLRAGEDSGSSQIRLTCENLLLFENNIVNPAIHLQTQQNTTPGAGFSGLPITAAQIVAPSSDIAGLIRLSTNGAGGQAFVTIVFNRPYTVAPLVTITAAGTNAAPGTGMQGVIFDFVDVSATGFSLFITDGGVAATDVQYHYHVIETIV